jgi:hypothetical protein
MKINFRNNLPSFAAIRDGNGGQQKRQQRSRTESVFIVRSSEKETINNICLLLYQLI